MTLIWLAPAAALGLIALLVPVLIHLLTNQQTRHVPFPTLRFLRRTRLAAIRRRSLQNLLLLAVRMLILALAVGALASPVLVSAARQWAWTERIARAVVVAPGSARASDIEQLIESERGGSFVSAVFRPAARLADGLRDAALWFERQPPAMQEVVLVGDLRANSLTTVDVALLPPPTGLRFLPLRAAAPTRDVDLGFREGETTWRAATTLHDSETRVTYTREGNRQMAFTVRAAPVDQSAADAALAAVFARGIDVDTKNSRRVVVVFQGGGTEDLDRVDSGLQPWMRDALSALPQTTGRASGDVLVVQTSTRATDRNAAQLVEQIARVAFTSDRSALEPAPLSVQAIAEWSRPPQRVESRRPGDEGDRRWFWGAALALLGIEMIVRRRRTRPADTPEIEESRVA